MADGFRIVVGIDFDATGDYALAMAVELARVAPSSELHIVHVVPETRTLRTANRIAADEQRMSEGSKRLNEHLDAWRAAWTGEAFERPMVMHVRIGDPAEELHQVGVDYDADILVVGTHGVRGLPRLVLGSVSERLMKLARMPVMVARPKNFEGLPKSQSRPDAPHPGQTEEDLHAPPSYELRGTLSLGGGSTHVSGAI